MLSKRVGILSCVNIRHMTMISIYTDFLKKNNIEYDIIYMDKYNEEEEIDCRKKYRYVNSVNSKWPRWVKALKYLLFYPYVHSVLRKENYDLLIVWNDVAICMFADYLSYFYNGKFCLNVRDNMWYDKWFNKYRYAKVFSKSIFTTISSTGYLDFLPKDKKINYIPIHSFNLEILKDLKSHQSIQKSNAPIRIGFIGNVRFFEINKKLLDVFSNDSRFELHYYGTNAHILEDYAKKMNIKNTVFVDTFPVSDTKKYLENIDIINNLYGNNTINLRKAVSIKFYHAVYAKIPILVCPDTYTGTLSKNLGIGFEVDLINNQTKEDLYKWYRALNFEMIDSNCNNFIYTSLQENKKLKKELIENLL